MNKTNSSFVYALLGVIVLVAGYLYIKQTRYIPPTTTEDMALALPRLEIDATITSLAFDTNLGCETLCTQYDYPRDIGVIRINKILSVDNPGELKLDEFQEGNEVKVRFGYSARPAKIKFIPPRNEPIDYGGPDVPVSHVPSSNQPVTKEDGHFVFTVENTEITEPTLTTTLPGLTLGSRFRGTLDYTGLESVVGDYTVVP